MLSHPLSYKIKLPVLILVYLISNSAFAQVYNSAVARGAGGTGRAAIEAGDAVFLNPATMAHVRGRFLASTFAKDEWALSFGDNTSESTIPGALGYLSRKRDVLGGTVEENDFALTLSEFFAEKWSIGVTAHYRQQKFLEEKYQKINGDIGILYIPREDLGLALVVYDIFGKDSSAPEVLHRKTLVGVGLNYIFKNVVRMRVDVTSESHFMAGIETYVSRFLITRVGYSNNGDESRELLTAGLGFKGPRFALNYGYEGNPQNSGDYSHSVDLVIPF